MGECECMLPTTIDCCIVPKNFLNGVLYRIDVPIFICRDKKYLVYANEALILLLGTLLDENMDLDKIIDFGPGYLESKFKGQISDSTLEYDGVTYTINRIDVSKQSSADKDKFIAIIAHDLRGPLSVFSMLTEQMIAILPSNLPDIKKYLINLEKSANNVYHLLENLLEWARFQGESIIFKPRHVALLSAVEESILSIRVMANNKLIVINCDFPCDLTIFADVNMLRSIIQNLVSNAVKFTAKEGIISISAIIEDNFVKITVGDTGVGINGNMIDNLFVPHIKTTRYGTGGEIGSGLGLILCKDFVEKHGGKIWVESTNFMTYIYINRIFGN